MPPFVEVSSIKEETPSLAKDRIIQNILANQNTVAARMLFWIKTIPAWIKHVEKKYCKGINKALFAFGASIDSLGLCVSEWVSRSMRLI